MDDERLSSAEKNDSLKIILKLPIIKAEPQTDNLFNLFSKSGIVKDETGQ